MRKGVPPPKAEPGEPPAPEIKVIESAEDWILEQRAGSPLLKGHPETSAGGPTYFLFIKNKGSDDFTAMPVEEWYNFRGIRRVAAALEDAEAEMKYRRQHFERINPRLAAAIKEEDIDGPAVDDRDDDSDAEFKDIKARAAVSAAAVKGQRDSKQAGGISDDDQEAAPDIVTYNDVFVENPPKDAEDWEHEDQAADDDLDMGNDDEIAGGEKSPRARSSSPSDSDDEAGPAKIHKTIKRMMMMKQSGLEESEEEGEDEEEGEEDESMMTDEEIEDADDLDRMASADAKDELAGGTIVETKKRKSPSPPAFEQDVKRAKGGDEKGPVSLAPAQPTGAVTEEEVITLLKSQGKMLLADMAAYFKSRLMSDVDRKAFTGLVKHVARLDPAPDPNGRKYLILK